MRIAADAGIAPALRYVDDAAGVAILDFIEQRPLQDYPGGALGLATAAGRLVAQLQQTAAFPELADYFAILERTLAYARRMFAAGWLLCRIRHSSHWHSCILLWLGLNRPPNDRSSLLGDLQTGIPQF
jgi:hypothetical protein